MHMMMMILKNVLMRSNMSRFGHISCRQELSCGYSDYKLKHVGRFGNCRVPCKGKGLSKRRKHARVRMGKVKGASNPNGASLLALLGFIINNGLYATNTSFQHSSRHMWVDVRTASGS